MLTDAQARSVVATATAAPSVHNTQPWRFTVEPDRLGVHADPQRALQRQDPSGRELLISCGAACYHAEIAVRGMGLTGTPSLLPAQAPPDCIAEIDLAPGGPATEEELRLLAAVPQRHTDRSAFADWPVPCDVLDRLQAAAAQEGAWLQVLTTADVLELALLQAHAQAALRDDAEAVHERSQWGRTDPLPSDGVPAELLPGVAVQGRAARAARVATGTVPDVVLVLGTAADDRLAWAQAGRALARVLLEATAAGLVAAPATLALELPAVRDTLTATLALQGSPQMVLRAGYPAGPGTARAGRRAVDEVLAPPVAGVPGG